MGWSGSGGFFFDTDVIVPGDTPISIGLSPSARGGADTGSRRWALIEFLTNIGTDASRVRWNGGLMIDRTGFAASTDINATDFPNGTFANVPLRLLDTCLLYTSPSPRDGLLSRMPSSA